MATVELKNKDREVELSIEKHIFDEDTKKRIYVAEVIKKALNQYLDYDNLQVDSSNSIYKLPIVNEKLDIIDFEINSLSVHVIPTIDKAKNHNVYIPKSYKFYNCKPDIIIFVNFTKSFAKMNILGFLTDFNANSLSVPVTSLISPDELITALKKLSPKRPAAQENAIQAAKELMLAYIDSSLSEEGEQYFLKNLISSKQIRKNYKLFYALNCKFISVAKRHTSLSDDSFVAVDSIPDEDDISNTTIDYNTSVNIEPDDIPQLTNFDEDIEITDIEDSQDIIENSESDFNISDTSEDAIELEENVDNSDELLDIAENNEAELAEMPIDENNMIVNDIDELPSEDIELENVQDEMPELDFSSLDDGDGFDLSDDGEEISLTEEEESQQVSLVDSNYNTQAILPEPEVTSPTVQAYEESAPQENTVNEEVSEATQENGDDVFSFLEEMADESQQQNATEQAEIQQTENILPLPEPEEQSTQENIELQNDVSYDSYVADNTEHQPVIEEAQTAEENIMAANSFNNAFAPNIEQATENIQENVQEIQPQVQTVQPAKSSSKAAAILLAAIAIGGIGAGVYFNKDKIPFLSSSSEIQGLEQTDNNVADLPAPIVNTQGAGDAQDAKTGTDTSANAAGAVPPAPTGDVAPAPAPAQTTAAAAPAPAAKEQELPSLPKAVEPPKPKHLNDAIATALTKDFAGVRISKVSWEVSETLVNNPDVKRYLTIAGKSIKNSLSQDLMAATEPSFKDNIVVNITYKKDGTVSQIKMASSSGSSQIDEIIAKSVRDTLNYVRMPALNLNKPEYTAKLIVRL